MAIFNLNINGKKQQVDVDPNTPMLWVLRDHLTWSEPSMVVVLRSVAPAPFILTTQSMRSCSSVRSYQGCNKTAAKA
jgi:isoquinoline 1-oxidoreductase alpha subunit